MNNNNMNMALLFASLLALGYVFYCQCNNNSTVVPANGANEIEKLRRMADLAGIEETCSGGASGAGGIASAPVAAGGMQRRPSSPKKTKTKKKTA